MGGILRRDAGEAEAEAQAREFDREQVRKNTELNAQLGSAGTKLRGRLHTQEPSPDAGGEKKHYPKTKAPAALQQHELEKDAGFVEPNEHNNIGFDEEGIEDWNKHRGQAQKILEPNTPYMGTAADTEYYDDDPVPEDLDLGSAA